MSRVLAGLLLCPLLALSQEEAGKIVRPVDQAHLQAGEVDIVARGPEGAQLTLDGTALSPEQPFPLVFHKIEPVPEGVHELKLAWPGGETSVSFYVGSTPPAGFRSFVQHPPQVIACDSCHGLSRRGRFRFTGGCFTCHEKTAFVPIHSHQPHELESCGLCHNAHGSTAAKLLLLPKETACKQCHN